MLNVQQILDEQILKLESTQGKPAQVGYDVSLKEVSIIGGENPHGITEKIGKILKDKTELATYTKLEPYLLDGRSGWILHPGVYDLVFNEGCKIPANRVGFIKQRSSLWRNGVLINSPVFDPGFETENMGTTMLVINTVFIEEGARVAQIYFHECESAELYNGQWQGDKQRQEQK